MMSPYGPAEKQALLEAGDTKTRAETLVAITEIALARDGDDSMTGFCNRKMMRHEQEPSKPARAVRSVGSVDVKMLELLVCPLTYGSLKYDPKRTS
jgi:hypothetical protein